MVTAEASHNQRRQSRKREQGAARRRLRQTTQASGAVTTPLSPNEAGPAEQRVYGLRRKRKPNLGKYANAERDEKRNREQ
eukprot:13924345-Ditylum_brightwellii.AAC.1